MYGSHLSIAGGLHLAADRARELGMESVQIFTKNQQQWKCKPLGAVERDAWRAAHQRHGLSKTVAHDSYLINLASPDDTLWRKSVELFAEEVNRAEALGISYLVTHPGAHMGTRDDAASEATGIERIAAAVDMVLELFPKGNTTVCLESTAGQGSSIGHKLEHLSDIIRLSKHKKRIGVCLDTAHLFAAGYDFRGRKYASLMRAIDATIGAERVKVWHLNDSPRPHRDRRISTDRARQALARDAQNPRDGEGRARVWPLLGPREPGDAPRT
jgi:deoxyribonuclease-4